MFLIDTNKIHSYVDIITNSSTVIYTYAGSAVEKAKELVIAMADVFGEKEFNVEKAFDFKVFPEDYEDYLEDWVESEEIDEIDPSQIGYTEINEYEKLLLSGSSECPNWFPDFIEWVSDHENYDGYGIETKLVVIPKDEKYKILGEKIVSFLYSTDHEASYG